MLNKINKKGVVLQLGARMHYAVPEILQNADMLSRLYTDLYIKSNLFSKIPKDVISKFPNGVRRILSRNNPNLSSKLVKSYPLFGMDYSYRRNKTTSQNEATRIYLWAAQKFLKMFLSEENKDIDFIYGYNSVALEAFKKYQHNQNVFCILEQTLAPRVIEREIRNRELDIFPGWERPIISDKYEKEFMLREEEELNLADLIVCGSNYVKNTIKDIGVKTKIQVVPYGVKSNMDRNINVFSKKVNNGKKLRVLTVGAIGLRKGSQYIAQASHELTNSVEFRMVGPVQLEKIGVDALTKNIEVIGPVSRKEVSKHYEWADVFLLPSLCEGSATVVYEAMSYGLPIICTKNTGSQIRNMSEGYIIPTRSSESIVERISDFVIDKDLREHMGNNSFNMSKRYDLDNYGQRLLKALNFN